MPAKRKANAPPGNPPPPKKGKKEPPFYTKSDLQKLKVADLKAICQDFDLNTNGLKADLMRRILEYQEESFSSSSSSSSSSSKGGKTLGKGGKESLKTYGKKAKRGKKEKKLESSDSDEDTLSFEEGNSSMSLEEKQAKLEEIREEIREKNNKLIEEASKDTPRDVLMKALRGALEDLRRQETDLKEEIEPTQSVPSKKPQIGVKPDFPEKFEQRQQPFKLGDLFGVDDVVEEAMAYVDRHCPQETDDNNPQLGRVPPVMIASLSRSGKTTTLHVLFNTLLDRKYTPIYVTFNENSNFKRKQGERDVDAFLRVVAGQMLGKTPEEQKEMVCTKEELDGYLKNATKEKPVVLLVDELNVLCGNQPPSNDLAEVLRDLFLNPAHRYLCFSSHWALDVIGDTRSGRSRCVVTVAWILPTRENVNKLRKKWKEQLVPAEVAFHGGLVGLLYSCKVGKYDTSGRFQDELHRAKYPSPPPAPRDVTSEFLEQFCDGNRCLKIDEFYGRFTARLDPPDRKESIMWPLCYAQAFLKEAECKDLSHLIDTVKSACTLGIENHGLDWEFVARLAVAFVLTRQTISYSPNVYDILGLGGFRPRDIMLLKLQSNNLNEAQEEMREYLSPGVIVFASSYSASFPEFDVILGWLKKGKGKGKTEMVEQWKGLQMKAKKGVVTKDASVNIPGILLRGDAPQSGKPSKRVNWKYVTRGDLERFMPYSLLHLIPGNWEIPSSSSSSSSSSSIPWPKLQCEWRNGPFRCPHDRSENCEEDDHLSKKGPTVTEAHYSKQYESQCSHASCHSDRARYCPTHASSSLSSPQGRGRGRGRGRGQKGG